MRKDIAVIGISGRFPQANSLADFHENLKNGRDSIRNLSEKRKRDTGLKTDEDYWMLAYLEDIDKFDANFFGVTPAEAETMDPHQRLLLEVAYEAFENAGYNIEDYSGTNTAVFLADTHQRYYTLAKAYDPLLITGNANAVTAGRIARFFNLWGAALMIDTACSSSLVAIHMACQEISVGACDQALVCAANLQIFPEVRQNSDGVGIMSIDGRNCTFSANATGTGSGEAVVSILLKPLEQALADADEIHAVIKGSAVNQDAQRSSSLTAPSALAQAEVIKKAWKVAGIDPTTVSYIEAHGTATKLGDPIEVDGISLAFREFTDRKQFCAVSSVKSNIGHTNFSAGIVGFVKVVLSLKHRQLFPSLHFDDPNPFIDFIESATYVNTILRPWESENERRCAGVSSFGISGTNCHIVLQEAPHRQEKSVQSSAELITISSKTRTGLKKNANALIQWLASNNARLEDVSYVTTKGRKHFDHRHAVVASDAESLLTQLKSFVQDDHAIEPSDAPAWFVLSGNTPVDDALLDAFSARFSSFRKCVAMCVDMLSGIQITSELRRFIFQYALCNVVLDRGIPIGHVLGTGTGKVVIALLQKKITLAEAIRKVSGIVSPQENLKDRLPEFITTRLNGKAAFVLELGVCGEVSDMLRSLKGGTDRYEVAEFNEASEEKLLYIARELYIRNVNVNWNDWWKERPGQRIAMPAYQFEPVRYWLDNKAVSVTTPVEDWLYELKWVESRLDGKQKGKAAKRFLVLSSRTQHDNSFLADVLTSAHAVVYLVPGSHFRQISSTQYEIGTSEQDCFALRACLQQHGFDFDGFILLGATPSAQPDLDHLDTELDRSLYPYLHFLKAFSVYLTRDNFQLVHVAERSQIVHDSSVSPLGHAVYAAFKAMQSDFPFADIRAIDVDQAFTAEALRNELTVDAPQKFVAYRKGERYVLQLEKINRRKETEAELTTKPGGVYLITGGGSGVGLEISKAIAAKGSCNLVIIGRTVLPEREKWRSIEPNDPLTERVQALIDIEGKGCNVDYFAADVCDKSLMEKIVSDVYAKYGRIDGIVHVAGVMLYKSVEEMTLEELMHTIYPKVHGSMILGELVDTSKLDWFVMFSSLNAVVPQKHTIAYTVANAFEDGYAQWLRGRGVKAMAINWGAWGEAGQGRRDIHSQGNQNATLRAWSNRDGISGFAMAVELMHVNPIIADVSWKAFYNNPFFLMKDVREDDARRVIDSAELDGLTEVEGKLLQIWYDVLKVNRITLRSSFFDLGGHSLLAARLINLISEQFQVQIKFKDILQHPVFADQCAYLEAKISQSLAGTFSAIPTIEEQDYYRASHAQKRLWILYQFEKGSATNYNITQVFTLQGSLHKPALEKTFSELIKRHEILRTTFVVIDHEPFQKVANALESRGHIIYTDLYADGRKTLQDHIKAEENFQFDLEKGPLMRVVMIQVGPEKYACILTMHHIISDGWSIGILRDEIATLYEKFSANLMHTLAPLRIQYKDYSAWQEKQLTGSQLENHVRYWQTTLGNDFPRLEFPSDRPRTATNRYRAKFVLLKDLPLSSLDRIGRECDASLFMVLVATVKILLSRYTEQSDIVIGAPFACRNHRDLENQIGFYVNTLPLRTVLNPDQGFKENLARVKETILGVSEHENYPFDLLVERLHLERDVNRSPVFDIVVTLQVGDQSAAGDWSSTSFQRSQDEESAGKFDLFFEFIQSSDEMWLAVNYNPDLYSRARIDRMTSHYRNMVSTIVDHVSMPIRELPLLGNKESKQLLVDFNRHHVFVESPYTLHQHFEFWAARTPDAVAIAHHHSAITYRALNERANCLATLLRNTVGVKPEQVIAVMLERSVNMVLSILAVWKAGAAYLPIDPGLPEERQQYLIADARARLLLTDRTSAMSSIVETLLVDETLFENCQGNEANPEHVNAVKDLAYVIYTSGTTGTPKGVMIQHDTVVATLINQGKVYSLNESDRLLQFATITFDASVYEIGLAFCHGATLVMIDKATIQDNVDFVRYVRVQGVTWTLLPPSYVNVLDPAELNTLKTLVTGGEAGNMKTAAACLPYFRYFNAYGPTECSIVATIHEVASDAQESVVLPIGRPQAGTEVYIVDQHGNLMPIGVPGELCIGGKSVGRGYLNREELTAAKFIKNPFGDGHMYRTGDIAYWNTDGTVAFLGRRDNQVKVRGYRIELDEIQRVLLACPGVKDAVVVIAADVDTGNTLVAYVTTQPGVKREMLHDHLTSTLPSYMIPPHLIVLDELPLKSNGKVDKKALPLPAMDQGIAEVVENGTAMDKLRSIWKEVLAIEHVSATDDFFKVGGDSLKAIRLRGRIAKGFNKTISIKDIFDFPTLEKLAQVVERALQEDHDSILPIPSQPDYALSRAQKRLWVLDQAEPGQNAYNVFGSLILEGDLDRSALENAFRGLIQRHEILRTVFVTVNGEPRQRILDAQDASFAIDYTDLSSEPGGEEMAYTLRQAETVKVFDLATDRLLRVQLIRVADQRYVFGLTMHHIIADGWSLEIIIHEVLTFYNAFVGKRKVGLEPLRIQYKDYAHWHNTQLTGIRFEKLRKYWRSKLVGKLPVIDLPLDYPRPKRKTYHGASAQLTIDSMLSDRLMQLEHRFDVSRFMLLLASVKTLLFRYTFQNDMIIGAVTAGRNHSDLENQIGYYLNTLAIRTAFAQGDRFADLLLRVKTTVVEAFEHEMYPFDLMIDDLDIERDVSRSPVFDVLVNLQSTKGIYQQTGELEGLRVSELPTLISTTKYDLTFIFRETDNGISLVMLYNRDLFKPETASLLLVRLNILLEAVATDPMIPLERIELSSEPQVRHQAVEMNFDF